MPALRFTKDSLRALVEELEYKNMTFVDIDSQGTCFGVRPTTRGERTDCLRIRLLINIVSRKFERKAKVKDLDKIIFKQK